MMNHKAKYCRQLKNEDGGGNAEGIPKPETKYIDRVRHFCCTHCDFVAKSSGKVYSHMVADHGYKKLVCDFCKLSTANATSFHNHKTKYCRSLGKRHKGTKKTLLKISLLKIILLKNRDIQIDHVLCTHSSVVVNP